MSTRGEKPVDNVEVVPDTEISVMSVDESLTNDKTLSKSKSNGENMIPRNTSEMANSSTKRKSDMSSSNSNKMMRSLGNKPHNDIARGRYEHKQYIDLRTFCNHRKGRMSYHKYREQHRQEYYDDKATRNFHSHKSNDMI